MIELIVDSRTALAAFDRLIQLADQPGVLLAGIGEYLVESTQHRIAVEKQGPDGEPWTPGHSNLCKKEGRRPRHRATCAIRWTRWK